MFLRQHRRRKNGKEHVYWSLVESYRTGRGSRQRVVAYLGQIDAAGQLGVKQAAQKEGGHQGCLFDSAEPAYVEVDVNRLRVERCLEFGGPWLGLQILRKLDASLRTRRAGRLCVNRFYCFCYLSLCLQSSA
ncbi:MAG: hypothetical protein ACYS7M_04790 [Planctomycetota bacterium]|jgi:hypothetical protein